jgi:CRP-like cAMP-binding protein
MTSPIAELDSCALFSGLNQGALAKLADLVESETFPAGSLILQQGLSYRSLWVVLRGRCEVVRLCRDRTDQQLAVLERGGIFGEMSFFQEAPHSATVRAITEVEALRITPLAFEKLKSIELQAACVISINLVRLLADRLRRMDNWTCDLVNNSSDRRQYAEWQEFQSRLYTDWSF